jgi:hypothetical protein
MERENEDGGEGEKMKGGAGGREGGREGGRVLERGKEMGQDG